MRTDVRPGVLGAGLVGSQQVGCGASYRFVALNADSYPLEAKQCFSCSVCNGYVRNTRQHKIVIVRQNYSISFRHDTPTHVHATIILRRSYSLPKPFMRL